MEHKVEKILFIKPMVKYPDTGLEVGIKAGDEFKLEDSNYFPVNVNTAQLAGTVYINANTCIASGHARVINQ